MKLAITLLLLAASHDPRIGEGLALHKAGQYDQAIAKYKAVLADDPANTAAMYEMAFSYEAKGDLAQCRAVLEPIADKSDPMQPLILNMLGSCLDKSGNGERAIALYRKGLELAPDNGYLLYHLAVALHGQKQSAEAKDVLRKELALRPGHAGGHELLGRLFEDEDLRLPAALEYLRMLGYEAGTRRAQDAAERMAKLLDLKPSTFETTRWQLATWIRALIAKPPEGCDATVRENLAFFAELDRRKLLDTYVAFVVSSLDVEGREEWAKATLENDAAAKELVAYLVTFPR